MFFKNVKINKILYIIVLWLRETGAIQIQTFYIFIKKKYK